MYTLAFRRAFSCRHFLVGGDWGSENSPHGHDYTLEIRLRSGILDRHGYVADIVDVEQGVEELLARYRERLLNDLPEFAGLNPSIEHFCRILHGALKERLGDGAGPRLTVRLWETPDIWAAYADGE